MTLRPYFRYIRVQVLYCVALQKVEPLRMHGQGLCQPNETERAAKSTNQAHAQARAVLTGVKTCNSVWPGTVLCARAGLCCWEMGNLAIWGRSSRDADRW